MTAAYRLPSSDVGALPVFMVNGAGAPAIQSASGYTATATFTPTAAAYGAGDIMDAVKEMTFTNTDGILVPSGAYIRILTSILKIDLATVPASQTSFDLQLYGVTPPSAQADNDTWTLASADLPTYGGSFSLGTPADLGASLYIRTKGIDFDVRLTGTSLFARLVTTAGHTATAVARTVTLHAVVM